MLLGEYDQTRSTGEARAQHGRKHGSSPIEIQAVLFRYGEKYVCLLRRCLMCTGGGVFREMGIQHRVAAVSVSRRPRIRGMAACIQEGNDVRHTWK